MDFLPDQYTVLAKRNRFSEKIHPIEIIEEISPTGEVDAGGWQAVVEASSHTCKVIR